MRPKRTEPFGELGKSLQHGAGQKGVAGLRTFGAAGHAARSGDLDTGDPAAYCAMYVPDDYEPGYAYPLIVWFHDEGGDEQDVLRIIPRISPRNFLGLGLRGPLPVVNGVPRQRRWSLGDAHLRLLDDELAVSLNRAAEQFNIHPNRVILAGIGQGATVALRMLLRRPEWFAGAACLGADLSGDGLLECWGQYADKPLWLGHILGWSAPRPSAAICRARLLSAAGFQVATRVLDFEDADPARLAADIDRWLLQSLCPETVVL